ncbi:hypothetical protein U1Q18_001320 [Sarracenia purpurea var. burkii]
MFQGIIKHHQRFNFERIPAVVELCWQAGADPHDESLTSRSWNLESAGSGKVGGAECLSSEDLRLVARGTLRSWEVVWSGVVIDGISIEGL